MFVLLIASFNGSTALAITCNMTLNLNMFYSFRTWLSLGFHYISWYRTSSVHNVFFKTKQNQINCRQKYFHIKFILLFKTIILKTGLRWRNRRMWSSPPATSTSKYIYTRENSQNTCWKLTKCLIKPKLQERLPYNQAGWKWAKGIVRWPATLGGSCARGKVPSPWEALSLARGPASTEKELHRLRGERSCWLAAGRTEKELLRRSWPSHSSPQPETCTCWCPQGQGGVTQASGDRTRERTGTGCTETAVKGWRVAQANTRDGHTQGAGIIHWSPKVSIHTQRAGQGPTGRPHSPCAPSGPGSVSMRGAGTHLLPPNPTRDCPHRKAGLKSKPIPRGWAASHVRLEPEFPSSYVIRGFAHHGLRKLGALGPREGDWYPPGWGRVVTVTVVSARTCAQMQGWVLADSAALGRSRCMTTADLVPDFRGSVPTDLCYCLHEQSA